MWGIYVRQMRPTAAFVLREQSVASGATLPNVVVHAIRQMLGLALCERRTRQRKRVIQSYRAFSGRNSDRRAM